SLLSQSGVREIPTQEGLEMIADGKAVHAEIIDGDQRVNLELESVDTDLGTKDVFFYYVFQRGDAVIDAINEADLADGYTDQVPQPSAFWSFMGFIFPLLLIGLLIWWMLSSMAAGGGRGVMQFGKNKAKLVSKEMSQVTFADV